MADPTILLKLARMLGQATNKRGVSMLGPLQRGLRDDPEILQFFQAANKAAKGISPKVLQDASSGYQDLLQSATTHFKRGMPPTEMPKAAKAGINEYLESARDKLARTRQKVELPAQLEDPKSIFARLSAGEEGSSGLGAKAKQIYEAASPRLKAYLDHIVDPNKPRPKGGRKVFQEELRTLRGQVTGKRLTKPATRGKTVEPEPLEPGPGPATTLQQTPGRRSVMSPEEVTLAKSKAETVVPEGEDIAGAIWPGFEAPRPLAEPSGARQVPIRGEFGPLDIPPEQMSFEKIAKAFKELFPIPKKSRRSLKDEVSPE